jgi:hypothetical protein
VGLTTLPPFVSRLSRQCGILNISQPCWPPRPIMGLDLFFLYNFTEQVDPSDRESDWNSGIARFVSEPGLSWPEGGRCIFVGFLVRLRKSQGTTPNYTATTSFKNSFLFVIHCHPVSLRCIDSTAGTTSIYSCLCLRVFVCMRE